MSTHRTLAGDWEVCEAPRSCTLLFHMEASVAELSATPLELLLPLFEIVQPPSRVDPTVWSGERGLSKEWLNSDGEPHRDYDLPAYIGPSGMAWYEAGYFHRERGPAQVFEDGGQVWWRHDQVHREDGPAQVFADGTQVWWRDGEVHRADGPARVDSDGSIEWWWRGSRIYDLSLVPQWAPYLTQWGAGS